MSSSDEVEIPIDQLSIDPANDDMRTMDCIIEFAAHNDMAATIGEACIQISPNTLCQFRRCTLKSMVIFYVKTIIMMDHRNLLHDALQVLQKLFEETPNKKVYKAYQALMRGMKYQVVLYNLETKPNGALHAIQIIDEYFPKTSVNVRDNRVRQMLLNICNKHQKGDKYHITSWDSFKNWTKASFKVLLSSCGESVIEQIAKKRMMRKKELGLTNYAK